MAHLDNPAEQPSAVREFLVVLRYRKWSVVGVTVIAVVTALALSYRQTPRYEAEARVLVKAVLPLSSGVPASEPDLATERELASSSAVAEGAARQVGLGADEIEANLTVDLVADTKILTFTYESPDPTEASRAATAAARAYIDFRRSQTLADIDASTEALELEIEALNGQLARINGDLAAATTREERSVLDAQASVLIGQIAVLQQRVSDAAAPRALQVGEIVEEAEVPESPASPNHFLNVGLALLAGLTLGIGVAFLRERLDDRLRGREDLEAQVGAPVLAVIPRIRWKKGRTPLATLEQPHGAASEAYRALRTAVLFTAAQQGLRTLLITSPQAGEGKTSLTANLGVALAQAGRDVVLISADFRRPRLHRFFEIENSPGLSDVLAGRIELHDAIRPTKVPKLSLLPSGSMPAQPAEMLGSERMGQSIAALREASEFVIIDSPPVLAVSDAITLAPFVDAVVFVADAEGTSRGSVVHARHQLDQVDAGPVGAVYNNFDSSKARSAKYYYRYYYRDERRDPAPPTESSLTEGGS